MISLAMCLFLMLEILANCHLCLLHELLDLKEGWESCWCAHQNGYKRIVKHCSCEENVHLPSVLRLFWGNRANNVVVGGCLKGTVFWISIQHSVFVYHKGNSCIWCSLLTIQQNKVASFGPFSSSTATGGNYISRRWRMSPAKHVLMSSSN